jgi:hypothetical protein
MLFGQNQFAVTGNSQTVFLTVMFDDDFMVGIEQLLASEFSFTAGGFS